MSDKVDIDVEKIMEEIRAEIKEKGYKSQDLSFKDTAQGALGTSDLHPDSEIEEILQGMSTSWEVPYYWELKGNPVKVFCQKVIRKAGAFLFAPIFTQQSLFNRSVYDAANYLAKIIKKQDKQIEELRMQIEDLKKEKE